jgi:hypothetical protein
MKNFQSKEYHLALYIRISGLWPEYGRKSIQRRGSKLESIDFFNLSRNILIDVEYHNAVYWNFETLAGLGWGQMTMSPKLKTRIDSKIE